MQHILNDDEYREFIDNKEIAELSKENIINLKNTLAKCDKMSFGFCDKCPLQDTKYNFDSYSYACMLGRSKEFSK